MPGDRGKQRDPFPDPCTAVTRVTLRHLEGDFKNIPKPVRCNQLIKKTRVFMYMLEGWGRRRGGNEPRGSHPFRFHSCVTEASLFLWSPPSLKCGSQSPPYMAPSPLAWTIASLSLHPADSRAAFWCESVAP